MTVSLAGAPTGQSWNGGYGTEPGGRGAAAVTHRPHRVARPPLSEGQRDGRFSRRGPGAPLGARGRGGSCHGT